jgi:hypothetical protein
MLCEMLTLMEIMETLITSICLSVAYLHYYKSTFIRGYFILRFFCGKLDRGE